MWTARERPCVSLRAYPANGTGATALASRSGVGRMAGGGSPAGSAERRDGDDDARSDGGAPVGAGGRSGQRAARAYVAGPLLGDALEAGRRAASRGFAMALGFWDGGEPPRQVADTYARALDGMTAAGLEGYLSIKAPALALLP